MTEDQIIDRILNDKKKIMLDNPTWFLECCETPIERVLAWALDVYQDRLNERIVRFCGKTSFDQMNEMYSDLPWREKARIYCWSSSQTTVGSYRCDFIFMKHIDKLPAVRMVVECDGHEFHEKNKSQAAKDKYRDRSLIASGCHVMRFSGSEIWNNPAACARSIYTTLGELAGRAEMGHVDASRMYEQDQWKLRIDDEF